MDHTYIEEHQIADRYVLGTLSAEETERFENHYLSCPECLDRLDLAESVQQGFQRMAEQDATQLRAARQLALVAWLARLGRGRQLAFLLAAVLVLLLLPAVLVFQGIAGRERDRSTARSASAARSARSAAEVEALRAELAASRRDLAGERAARARATEQLAQAQEPQGNVPILFLDVERGARSPGASPTHRLRLPSAAGWIVLSLQIDSPYLPSYRAVLKDAHDKEIWRVTDLQPNERDTLSLTLPGRLVPPGDYSLEIAGLTPGAKPTAAGRVTFRVLPPA